MCFCLDLFDDAQWWYVELQASVQKLITIFFAIIAKLLLPSAEMGVSLGEVLIPVE
jgi:hypothetical protein